MLRILPILILLTLLSISACTSDPHSAAEDNHAPGLPSAGVTDSAASGEDPAEIGDSERSVDVTRTGAEHNPSTPAPGPGTAAVDAHVPGQSSISSGGSTALSGERVAILDHGFRMARGTEVIPSGWTLRQDIATDPSSARVLRYHLEISGPGGELIKGLGTVPYGQVVGASFAQALNRLVINGLGGAVEDVSVGALQRSAALERMPEFQKAMRLVQSMGTRLEALEAPLQARRDGRAVAGVVYVGHFSSAGMPGIGSLQASVVIAPRDRIAAAVRVNEQIARSYRANPQFEQRLAQVHASAMQQSQAAHQQRMAASQAQFNARQRMMQNSFDAHQNMMQDRYEANDRQHDQWMDNFRSSGSSAWEGSDYTGHDALVDGIHEQTSFQDPYSGLQVERAGQYDYWYNNGLGEYYGTDDPNFDPNSMDGDWQRIEPLTPTP